METAVDETMDQVTHYNPLFDMSLSRSERYSFQHDDLKPAPSRRHWSFTVIIIWVILQTALDAFLIYKVVLGLSPAPQSSYHHSDNDLDLNLLIQNNSQEANSLRSHLWVLQNQVKSLCGEEGQLQRLRADLNLLNTSNHNLENKLTNIRIKTGPPGTNGLPGQQGPKGERGPKDLLYHGSHFGRFSLASPWAATLWWWRGLSVQMIRGAMLSGASCPWQGHPRQQVRDAGLQGPTLEPGLEVGHNGEHLVAGLLPMDPGPAQPEEETLFPPPMGPPLVGGAKGAECSVGWVLAEGRSTGGPIHETLGLIGHRHSGFESVTSSDWPFWMLEIHWRM
ncbi:hypothetical protein CCH79_00019961, partial [Gambusia affinis]